MIRKLIILVLVLAALITGVAWTANFIVPLAILQQIGLVTKGSLGGAQWSAKWRLWENDEYTYRIYIATSEKSAHISWSTIYAQKRGQRWRHHWKFGPVEYRSSALDFPDAYKKKRLRDDTLYSGQSSRWGSVRLPLWALFVLFTIYPARALIRGPLRRRYRRKHNLCLKCGYNLTGLTEPRCPECFTAV